jgi:hypothetical protein
VCDNAHLYERNSVNNIRYVVRRQKSIFETRCYAPYVPPYEPKIYFCFETWRSVSFETQEDEAIYRSAAATGYAHGRFTPYSDPSTPEEDAFNILVDGVKMVGSIRAQRFNQSMMGGGKMSNVIGCRAQVPGSITNTEVYLSFS